MKRFFQFIGNTAWLIFQFLLAVGVTVLLLSIIPMMIIGILGLLGFGVAAQVTFMAMLRSAYMGMALGIAMFLLVEIVTLAAIVLLLLTLILTVSLIALPTSLLAQNVLRQNKIKSWLAHLLTYSISGAFVGGFLGTFPAISVWMSFKNIEHPEFVVVGVMILAALCGMFSVNACGVIVGVTNKTRDFVLARIPHKQPRLVIVQNTI